MILPIEQQVTSKNISEELQNRGVPQDSLFYHCLEYDFNGKIHAFYVIKTKEEISLNSNTFSYEVFGSAFTVSEIIEMILKGLPGLDTYFYINSLDPDDIAKELLRYIDSGNIHVGDL